MNSLVGNPFKENVLFLKTRDAIWCLSIYFWGHIHIFVDTYISDTGNSEKLVAYREKKRKEGKGRTGKGKEGEIDR